MTACAFVGLAALGALLRVAINDRLNPTAQTPARGGAKDFTKSIAEQRAHIAKIVKTLGIQPTR